MGGEKPMDDSSWDTAKIEEGAARMKELSEQELLREEEAIKEEEDMEYVQNEEKEN
jgi:hypothetical protein